MAKKLNMVEERLTERGVPYKLFKTEGKKHAIAVTKQAIDDGATTIVAMGGDGTLNEVLNGLHSFDKITFGLIPCGTGNDFASHIGLPLDPVKAIDLILDKEAVYTDFMQMPTVRGINVIGMGIDVEILKQYNALEKKTKIGYTNCLISALFSYKCQPFDFVADNESGNTTAFIACVANGNRFGGGIKICPDAVCDDGKLDFLYVDEITGLRIPFALLKLKAGKIFSIKQTHRKKIEKVKISSNAHTVVNVDGELYEDIPFEVEIVRNTLKMHR